MPTPVHSRRRHQFHDLYCVTRRRSQGFEMRKMRGLMDSQLFCFRNIQPSQPSYSSTLDFLISQRLWPRSRGWVRSVFLTSQDSFATFPWFLTLSGIGESFEVIFNCEARNVAKSGYLTSRNRRVAKVECCESRKVANLVGRLKMFKKDNFSFTGKISRDFLEFKQISNFREKN